jgi:hypothetical protein
VEAGIFRLNRVKSGTKIRVDCASADERDLPETFVDYDEEPREYLLRAVTSVVDIHTRISDLYSVPHNQIAQQLRLTIEAIKEQQENELVNSPELRAAEQCRPGANDFYPPRCADAGRP